MSIARDLGLVAGGMVAGAAAAVLGLETYFRVRNEKALEEAMESLVRINETLTAKYKVDRDEPQEEPEEELGSEPETERGEKLEPVAPSQGVVVSRVEAAEQKTPYHRMMEAVEQQKVTPAEVHNTGDSMLEEIEKELFYQDETIAGKVIVQIFVDGSVPIVVMNGEEEPDWQSHLTPEVVQRVINFSRGTAEGAMWFRNHRMNTDYEVSVATP